MYCTTILYIFVVQYFYIYKNDMSTEKKIKANVSKIDEYKAKYPFCKIFVFETEVNGTPFSATFRSVKSIDELARYNIKARKNGKYIDGAKFILNETMLDGNKELISNEALLLNSGIMEMIDNVIPQETVPVSPELYPDAVKKQIHEIQAEYPYSTIRYFSTTIDGKFYEAYFRSASKIEEVLAFQYDAQEDSTLATWKLMSKMFICGNKELVDIESLWINSLVSSVVAELMIPSAGKIKTF